MPLYVVADWLANVFGSSDFSSIGLTIYPYVIENIYGCMGRCSH